MSDLFVAPDAIRQYGDLSASMAVEVAAAAATDQAAVIAAAIPVFGLIGQDFLAAFAAAQADHLTSVAELAAVHAGTALTAYQSAGLYEGTDLDSGVGLEAAVRI